MTRIAKAALLGHLRRLDACDEAIEWVESTGRMSAERAWETCPRADWLMWLAGRAGVDQRVLVLAACDCARTVLMHVPTGEGRPLAAIEAAEGWAKGEVSIVEVRRAANAAAAYADAARAAARAADAATYAARAAARAAYAAADAAAYAAYAADAAAAARAAAYDAASRDMAGMVRARITWAMVAEGLADRAAGSR